MSWPITIEQWNIWCFDTHYQILQCHSDSFWNVQLPIRYSQTLFLLMTYFCYCYSHFWSLNYTLLYFLYHLRKGLKGYSPFVTLIISQIFSPCVFPLMPQSCRVNGLVSKLAFVIFWIKSWTNNCLKKKRYVWKFFTISYLYMHWNKKKHSFRIQITIPSPFWEMKVTFAHPNVHLNLFCCVTYYSLSKKKNNNIPFVHFSERSGQFFC